jgi:putative DNA primase/helicase
MTIASTTLKACEVEYRVGVQTGETATEDSLATELISRHPELRYCADLGGWLVYDGTRYARDQTLYVYDCVRQMNREAAHINRESSASRTLMKAATVNAVASLARSDRRCACVADDFDCDIWALNTPTGVLNLTSGVMQSHDPGQLLTRVTAVAPGGECPTWLRFLSDTTGGDKELEQYLQRLAGYCLTGSVKEQMLAFFYGPGGNGKGTFLNTLRDVLGDYAQVANIATFTASKQDRHLNELARLRGARIVFAQETEAGSFLAEARIKALSGGDPVVANFMHQNQFEYRPQFKLLFSGNHQPSIRSVDDAMSRRLHMVPFTQSFAGDKRDLELADKLKSEWPGILQWSVNGLMSYHENGLPMPRAVRAASEEYFDTEDNVGTWLRAWVEVLPLRQSGFETSKALYENWKTWCSASGDDPGTAKNLTQELVKRNLKNKRYSGGTQWPGIRLRQPSSAE